MSLILGGDAVLVRDAWAAIVPTFHQSVAHENKSQEDWVPRDLPDLEKWAYIGPYIGSRDATRRFLLFYTPEAEHRPPRQVVMRLQGYVEAANLATLGNWNGHPTSAPRAVQFLVLGPGKDGAKPHGEQMDTIERIRRFIFAYLQRSYSSSDDNSLRLQRRVFTKVTEGEHYRRLDAIEDPGGRANRIRSRWAVTHKLDIGRRNVDGTLSRLPFFGIKRGDFVDVTVTFDITNYGGKAGSSMTVPLQLLQVVQVYSPPPTKIIFSRLAGKASIQTQGFNFADDEMEE
ncbi:hypothetical protein NLI96_g4567 [Meripilus lineatus]|uniref:Uncharacterized protein n=1 Tax=Meripilus lineatus TaxID=2056292 RepID=A0AAD5YJT0_9APHY|nr:hypothetical protein NLI96_g4567 [Physisporinus lineatus]